MEQAPQAYAAGEQSAGYRFIQIWLVGKDCASYQSSISLQTACKPDVLARVSPPTTHARPLAVAAGTRGASTLSPESAFVSTAALSAK